MINSLSFFKSHIKIFKEGTTYTQYVHNTVPYRYLLHVASTILKIAMYGVHVYSIFHGHNIGGPAAPPVPTPLSSIRCS